MCINKNLILFILIYLPLMSFCQTDKENTKSEIKWNQFKNEIALDCKFLNKDLNLNSIGSNLIYKKRVLSSISYSSYNSYFYIYFINKDY